MIQWTMMMSELKGKFAFYLRAGPWGRLWIRYGKALFELFVHVKRVRMFSQAMIPGETPRPCAIRR